MVPLPAASVAEPRRLDLELIDPSPKAPARPQRPLTDKGRQAEIAKKLEAVREKL